MSSNNSTRKVKKKEVSTRVGVALSIGCLVILVIVLAALLTKGRVGEIPSKYCDYEEYTGVVTDIRIPYRSATQFILDNSQSVLVGGIKDDFEIGDNVWMNTRVTIRHGTRYIFEWEILEEIRT